GVGGAGEAEHVRGGAVGVGADGRIGAGNLQLAPTDVGGERGLADVPATESGDAHRGGGVEGVGQGGAELVPGVGAGGDEGGGAVDELFELVGHLGPPSLKQHHYYTR